MKKYGLQLRAPLNQHKKMASKLPICPPSIFGNDDDDDDSTKEIPRQAPMSRSLQMVEEQQKKALEEDPLAFDYDGVYDKMKIDTARSRVQDQSKREPKYITSIIEKAKKREQEHEIIYERKLLKERSKDDHEHEGKEKFVTRAYKKQLAERAKWLEEERLQELREQKEDVTKKSDLSDFYFGLSKNVAFGAQSAPTSKQSKEQSRINAEKTEGSKPSPEAGINFIQDREQGGEQVPAYGHASSFDLASNVSNKQIPSVQNNIGESSNAVSSDKKDDQVKESKVDGKRFNRSDDAIIAARERFMARKKIKEQL